MQVYTAKWRETLVAVKLLLNTGVNLDNMEAAADLALSLSNPILSNLQQVGQGSRLGAITQCHRLVEPAPTLHGVELSEPAVLLCTPP